LAVLADLARPPGAIAARARPLREEVVRAEEARLVPGLGRAGTAHPRTLARGAAPGEVLGESEERLELLVQVVLIGRRRVLEEAGEAGEHARLLAARREVDEADEVEDERRGERAVRGAPRELERPAGAEEALEVDVVPGRLPVAERGHEVDA